MARQLSKLERPKEFIFTLDPFSIENGLLTPTMKLKRNVAQNYYQVQIDEMYAKIENQTKK